MEKVYDLLNKGYTPEDIYGLLGCVDGITDHLEVCKEVCKKDDKKQNLEGIIKKVLDNNGTIGFFYDDGELEEKFEGKTLEDFNNWIEARVKKGLKGRNWELSLELELDDYDILTDEEYDTLEAFIQSISSSLDLEYVDEVLAIVELTRGNKKLVYEDEGLKYLLEKLDGEIKEGVIDDGAVVNIIPLSKWKTANSISFAYKVTRGKLIKLEEGDYIYKG